MSEGGGPKLGKISARQKRAANTKHGKKSTKAGSVVKDTGGKNVRGRTFKAAKPKTRKGPTLVERRRAKEESRPVSRPKKRPPKTGKAVKRYPLRDTGVGTGPVVAAENARTRAAARAGTSAQNRNNKKGGLLGKVGRALTGESKTRAQKNMAIARKSASAPTRANNPRFRSGAERQGRRKK